MMARGGRYGVVEAGGARAAKQTDQLTAPILCFISSEERGGGGGGPMKSMRLPRRV